MYPLFRVCKGSSGVLDRPHLKQKSQGLSIDDEVCTQNLVIIYVQRNYCDRQNTILRVVNVTNSFESQEPLKKRFKNIQKFN